MSNRNPPEDNVDSKAEAAADARLDELYRAGEQEEPSAELDAAVLAYAAKKSEPSMRVRWRSTPLLATAAAVALTVGVFVNLEDPLESQPLLVTEPMVLQTPSASLAAAQPGREQTQSANDAAFAQTITARERIAPDALDDEARSARKASRAEPAFSPTPASLADTQTPPPASVAAESAKLDQSIEQRELSELSALAGRAAPSYVLFKYPCDAGVSCEDGPPQYGEVRNPNCVQPWVLSADAHDLSVGDRGVLFRSDSGKQSLICADGVWQLQQLGDADG